MTRHTYTPTQKAHALDLYKTTGPTATSRNTGIPKSTLHTWAIAAGVRTVRTEKTEAANAARSAEANARRAAFAGRSIALALDLLDRLEVRLNDEASTIPVKHLAVILGILADKHCAIARMDTDMDNVTAVDAWLIHLTGGTPPENTP